MALVLAAFAINLCMQSQAKIIALIYIVHCALFGMHQLISVLQYLEYVAGWFDAQRAW